VYFIKIFIRVVAINYRLTGKIIKILIEEQDVNKQSINSRFVVFFFVESNQLTIEKVEFMHEYGCSNVVSDKE